MEGAVAVLHEIFTVVNVGHRHRTYEMARSKTVYVSEATHRRLEILAARRNRSMGAVIGELVEREAEEWENVWLSPAGLGMQEHWLRAVWADPALHVDDMD